MPKIYDPDTGLPIIVKQPWEEFNIGIDLADRMQPGDTIVSVDQKALLNMGKVAGSSDLVLGVTASSGTVAQVRVTVGQDKENYKVSLRCTTVNGDKIEGDCMVWVRD